LELISIGIAKEPSLELKTNDYADHAGRSKPPGFLEGLSKIA